MWRVLGWIGGQYHKIQNNRGAETIEWLALAAVVVAILLAVMASASSIGQMVVGKIQEFIQKITI
jgi:hypothetical protein